MFSRGPLVHSRFRAPGLNVTGTVIGTMAVIPTKGWRSSHSSKVFDNSALYLKFYISGFGKLLNVLIRGPFVLEHSLLSYDCACS